MTSGVGQQGADGLEEVPRVIFSVTMNDGMALDLTAMCAEVRDGNLLLFGSRYEPEFLVAAFSAGSWQRFGARRKCEGN